MDSNTKTIAVIVSGFKNPPENSKLKNQCNDKYFLHKDKILKYWVSNALKPYQIVTGPLNEGVKHLSVFNKL